MTDLNTMLDEYYDKLMDLDQLKRENEHLRTLLALIESASRDERKRHEASHADA